jgi:transcriptional regulator of arginine metabolism
MLPLNMTARRNQIAEALEQQMITSQIQLQEILAVSGFTVTQATISRDLDELRAVKIPNDAGVLVYALPGEGGDPTARLPELAGSVSRLVRVGAELVSSVDYSGNNVIVRTPPGAAQYLAGTIDHTVLPDIIGSVAGDDSILLVTRALDGGQAVAAQILELVNRRGSSGTPKNDVCMGAETKGSE